MKYTVEFRCKCIEAYSTIGHAGEVCKIYCISRPTLRKWVQKYNSLGYEGLSEKSRRPKTSPNARIDREMETRILTIREECRICAAKIKQVLQKEFSVSLSVASIHKVLTKNKVKPLKRRKRDTDIVKGVINLPGYYVEISTKKLKAGLYQYTAIDRASRYRVLRAYGRRCEDNTLHFINEIIYDMKFKVRKLVLPTSGNFITSKIDYFLYKKKIYLDWNTYAKPKLNSFVVRSQQIDSYEFYNKSIHIDKIEVGDLNIKLQAWQQEYNYNRAHRGIGGKTPVQKCCDIFNKFYGRPGLYEIMFTDV